MYYRLRRPNRARHNFPKVRELLKVLFEKTKREVAQCRDILRRRDFQRRKFSRNQTALLLSFLS